MHVPSSTDIPASNAAHWESARDRALHGDQSMTRRCIDHVFMDYHVHSLLHACCGTKERTPAIMEVNLSTPQTSGSPLLLLLPYLRLITYASTPQHATQGPW